MKAETVVTKGNFPRAGKPQPAGFRHTRQNGRCNRGFLQRAASDRYHTGVLLSAGWFLVILVLVIGGSVAGVLGMLLAIPVAACFKIICEEVVLPPLRRWAATH